MNINVDLFFVLVVLTILKLTGVISISWNWILIPLIIISIIYILVIIILVPFMLKGVI